MIDKVRQISKQKSVSMIELAKRLGVSRGTLYNWNYGNVTVKDLTSIAAALDCSVFELMEPCGEYTHAYTSGGTYLGLLKTNGEIS